MAKAPPIPAEQRAFKGEKPDIKGSSGDRRDDRTGLQSGDPGDADASLDSQGRFANLNQNTSHSGNVQDRWPRPSQRLSERTLKRLTTRRPLLER